MTALPLPLPGPQPQRLAFGPVVIEWSPFVARPLQIDHRRLNGRSIFATGAFIKFRLGTLEITVPENFVFDGASIPRWLWWIPGFAPLGKHIWAALLHDWLCELSRAHPDQMDRAIADGIFEALLEHTEVGRWRGFAMSCAVAGYRRWNFLRGALAR